MNFTKSKYLEIFIPLTNLSMIVASALAFGDVNLTGTIQPQVIINRSSDNHATIEFDVLVQNIGSSPIASPMKLKPFILPRETHPYRSNDNNGMVLPTMTANINIAAGGFATVRYQGILPVDRTAPYLLSVVLNPDHAIEEADQRDNATDFVSLGVLQPTRYDVSAGFDIYTETPKGFDFYFGGISHALRTIMRGASTLWPNSSSPDGDLWARFMLADTQNLKVFSLPYNAGVFNDVDKQWFAIAWNPELEKNGNAIVVDYYTQSPSFEHVPPGDYKFLVLMNTRDKVAENNPYNNLEARPVTISPFRLFKSGSSGPKSAREIWLVQKPTDTAAPSANVELWSSYATAINWSLPALPSWLAASVTSGEVGAGVGRAFITFTANAARGTEVVRRASLPVVASRFATPSQIPINFFSWSTQAPVLALSTNQLSFRSTQTQYPPAQTFTVSNTGTAPMDWAIDHSCNWLTVSPSMGTILPGQSQVVTIDVYPNVLSPRGVDRTVLTVLSSAQNDHPEIAVDLTVSVR